MASDRSSLALGKKTGGVGGSLRHWAESRGDRGVAAAVELVICFGLADDSYTWIRHGIPGSQWPEDTATSTRWPPSPGRRRERTVS